MQSLPHDTICPLSLKALRHCVGAGEPLNPEVIKIWEKTTSLTIRDGYGQTETVLLCGNFPPLAVKPGSMGKPSPGFDVSIIDHDGSKLPPGQEGDIAVRIRPQRPAWMFQEYWRNPEATVIILEAIGTLRVIMPIRMRMATSGL